MFLLPVETLTERRPLSYGAPPERGMRLHTAAGLRLSDKKATFVGNTME